MKLTERAGRGITPTPAGVAYARYATDVLALLGRAPRWRRRWRAGPGVTCGSRPNTAGEYLLPPLVRAFRERRPALEVSVHVGNRQEVLLAPGLRGRSRNRGARPRGRRPRGGSVPRQRVRAHHCARRSPRAAPVGRRRRARRRSMVDARGGIGDALPVRAVYRLAPASPPLLTLGPERRDRAPSGWGWGSRFSLVRRSSSSWTGRLATISPRGVAEARLARGRLDRRAELGRGRGVHRIRALGGRPGGPGPPWPSGVKHRVRAGHTRHVAVVRVDSGADRGASKRGGTAAAPGPARATPSGAGRSRS